MVSDADRKKAEQEKLRSILTYVGSTLLSVLLFSAIAFCFVKDPKSCILAFGTGCPCCILCLPCYFRLRERWDPKKKMKENLNKYLPGMIIHEDGTIEAYDASPEELEIVADIIDEIAS